MRTKHHKQLFGLLKPVLTKKSKNIRFFQIIAWLMISIGLFTLPVLAAKDNKKPSKRFTAERVFDMEYAKDPQVSPDGKTIVYLRQSMDKMTDQDVGKLWSLDIKSCTNRPLIADKPFTIAVEILREGKNVSQAMLRAIQDNKICVV